MKAAEITDETIRQMTAGSFQVGRINFANGDMVGHTGIMRAAIKAVDTIDECLGKLIAAINKAGGVMLLTADHGNIELMKDQETGEPFTAHTTFDVPIIALGAPAGAKLENGRLADIAPTVLSLMGIEKPAAMTGHSLLAGVSVQKENA